VSDKRYDTMKAEWRPPKRGEKIVVLEPSGAVLRDAAIDAVGSSKTGAQWIDEHWDDFELLATEKRTFTTDDLWACVDDEDWPEEPRVMGAVISKMKRDGLITHAGYYVKSVRKKCHARPLMVWRTTK